MNQNPWREVEHIEHTTGTRGGEVWFLTLSCGHHKAVPIPKYRIEFAVMVTMKDKNQKRKKMTAPHKCRCVICGVINMRNFNEHS